MNLLQLFPVVLVSFAFLAKTAKGNNNQNLRHSTRIQGGCVENGNFRPARKRNSCGVPDFVDVDEFGDNMDTTGFMRVTPSWNGGLNIRIKLNNLPKPDLVLTAWLIWTPFGDVDPPVFQVANHASPLASPFDGYTTGYGRDPNEFKYIGNNRAVLDVKLPFNPTYPGEGALTRETFCFQKDVPLTDGTAYEHYPATNDGVLVPTSSSYLRMYDPETGFEVLDANGDPEIVRSPVKAMGVEVIAHTDKTTHGVSQGVGGVDHYFIMFFPFEAPIGQPSMY